jgi:predicted metal-dependent phosphoesterase TrpH
MTDAPNVKDPDLLICDLHIHTAYSRDCLTSPDLFLETCRRKGLDRAAVTDHGTIAGALRLKEMAPERIIIGQEVYTTHGELIAYFLTEQIPRGLSPVEAIDAVRAQGGIVGASHPLDRLRREAIGREALLPLLDRLDFLEVFNSRCTYAADNGAARTLAAEAGLLMTAGSDAHSAWEMGRARIALPPFDSPETFLTSLRSAQIWGKLSPIWVHFISTYAKLARRWGWAQKPDIS